jgi:hypothetical protein
MRHINTIIQLLPNTPDISSSTVTRAVVMHCFRLFTLIGMGGTETVFDMTLQEKIIRC